MKVLLVGLGSAGQRHARNLRAILGDELDLLAYRVRGQKHVITSELRLQPDSDVEQELGIRAFADLDDALAQEPDAVFITNPPALHMAPSLAAARAGRHLFIEKPLSHNLGGVSELIDLVDRKRLVCLVGYHFRFHPGVVLLQKLLDERSVGKVVAVRWEFGEYLPGWHPYEDYRETAPARRELGGGVLLSQIHDLDCLYALFGMPRRVFAVGGRLTSLETDVEDTASVLLEHVIDGRTVPVHLQQDYLRRPATRRCEVIGEDGRITLDLLGPALRVFDGDGREARVYTFAGFERNRLFLDEIAHFLACIRGDETPRVSARDGAQSLRMALAARESMEKGQVVALS